MSIFDRWTDLDPALALRRIEAAHGSAIFDRDSYTDPQRALHQIEDALSIELDDVAGALSFASLEAAIDAAVDTGSAPEWVPANAKIYIDLVNDRAWTEADGEVAINTLLGADANTENGWAESSYDAGLLTSDGYGSESSSPTVAFIGSALVALLGSVTLRLQFKDNNTVAASNTENFALLSADGNDAIELDVGHGGGDSVQIDSWNGSAFINILPIVNSTNGAVNVVALTIDGVRLELAANGSDPSTTVIDDTDRPAANPLVAAIVALSLHKFVQSITIYDPLPSTAGLSALSETGVTNTAPTSINLVWTDAGPHGSNGSYSQTIFTDVGAPYVQLTESIGVTDAQGNPAALTIVAVDAPGVLAIGQNNLRAIADFPVPGVFDFTLRATDLGGLYVEQEFTITVTA